MTESLAQAIGRNARALRLAGGVTLEQLAAAAATYGLPWSSGRVGDFESGRVAPTLPTIYAVALALRDVTGKPVALAELLGGAGEISLTDALTVSLDAVRDAFRGHPVSEVTAEKEKIIVVTFDELLRESDYRLVKDLGLDPVMALGLMVKLWGRVFSLERDGRAGPDANAQRKGQISRQLKIELLDAAAKLGAHDGND